MPSPETVDDLLVAGLKIIQARDGYRFSIDPILLCGFAELPSNARVVDLGTGNGVIPLLLAVRQTVASIVGVEVQPEMADRARRSIELNGLDAHVRIVLADLRHLGGQLEAASFDVVTANPPYRLPQTGRMAPVEERAAARHELAGGLADFISAAVFLLKSGGRFYLVYLAERLAELLAGLRSAGLEPKRLRLVHSRQGEPARLALVEARMNAGAGMRVESPLLVYQGAGRDYSPEVLKMYGMS